MKRLFEVSVSRESKIKNKNIGLVSDPILADTDTKKNLAAFMLFPPERDCGGMKSFLIY